MKPLRSLPGLLLVGCSAPSIAHPSPAAMDIAVPEQWSTPTTAAAGPPSATWWADFGDPRLVDLVERALHRNQDLGAAAARLDAAIVQSRIAGAELWPTLDAGFDAARRRQVFVGFPFGAGGVPSTTFTTYGVSLATNWELDLWGRVRSGQAAATADAHAAAADWHGARTSLAGQVCKAWFAAVEAGLQETLAEATVASYRTSTARVRDRFERGIGQAVDYRLALSSLHTAESELEQRRNASQAARRQLQVLLGDYPDAAVDAGGSLPVLDAAVPAGLPAELVARRPDLVAAERRLAAAGARVDQARAALYPRIALTATAGTNTDAFDSILDGDFFVWSVGGNLLYPLFAGGRLRGELQVADARQRQALASYGSSVLTAYREVESALAAGRLLRRQRIALAAAADQAAAAETLASQRYDRGVGSFLEVLEAQRRAIAARTGLHTLDRLQLDNRVDLHLALGGGFGPILATDDPALGSAAAQ